MHIDMKAVTMQSNKLVSNEVEVNHILLEPWYGKRLSKLFGQLNETYEVISQ